MNIARKAAAVFLACLALLLPLTAHAESGAALRLSAFESVNAVPGLTLTTDQKSYSLYSLVLMVRFQNKTRRDYDYGVQYYLEKYVDGQWYTFVDPDYIAYPALGYYLAAKSSMEHDLTITDSTGFYRYHGQIEPGTYRIVQPLRDEKTNETVYLAAEFWVTPDPPVEDTFLYAKEPVNLRLGPSTEYWALRELTLGERVSYISISGKWTLVRAGDQTGYVYGRYLAKDERDCYYNHFAMKALRAAGVKDARIVCFCIGVPYQGYNGPRDVYGDRNRYAFIKWTKPYDGSLTIYLCPDDASAKSRFAEFADSGMTTPDVNFSYFLQGRYVIEMATGGIGEVEPSRREQAFVDGVEDALRRTCEDYLGRRDLFRYAKEPIGLYPDPSTDHAALYALRFSERVSFIRKSGEWALVRARGQTGYVHGKYLAQSEADCYNSNFAIQLLRAAGARDAHAAEVYTLDPSSTSMYNERGVSCGCDRFVDVKWAKPYDGFLSIMVYPDDASAQKKFAELKSAQNANPDFTYSYFLSGRYILQRMTGTPFGLPPREQAFSDKLEETLKQACEGYIGNE